MTRIPLNEEQKAKIKQKFGMVCDYLEVDEYQLINVTKYMPGPTICIDFDEKQEKIVETAFPGKQCDFAVINTKDLPMVMRYMPPPNSGR